MVDIIFRQADGGAEQRLSVEPADNSLMTLAKAAGVRGIEAICGGAMACGTCHVHVDEAWRARLPPPSAEEQDILDCVPDPSPAARLSCQIKVTAALDGLIVTVPESQF